MLGHPPPPSTDLGLGMGGLGGGSSTNGIGGGGGEEEQPSRGTDYDDLSSWARLSVSPRLYPTSYSSLTDHTSFGYRSLALESPVLGPIASGSGTHSGGGGTRRESSTSLFGLSPLLGPSHYSTHTNGNGKEKEKEYDYSTFGQYHAAPPTSTTITTKAISPTLIPSHPTRRLSPVTTKSPHSHSFSANVDISPHSLPLPLPTSEKGKEKELPPLPPPLPIPDQDQQEEDPRIRAYAKLEFPDFDIYIQKLSVIVGRRPVSANRSNSGGGGVGLGAEGTLLPPPAIKEEEKVKLEDFVTGLVSEDDKEKEKEKDKDKDKDRETMTVPSLAFTPSSPARAPPSTTTTKQKKEDDEVAFSEFLKSSPTLGPTKVDSATPPPPTSDAAPPIPTTTPATEMIAPIPAVETPLVAEPTPLPSLPIAGPTSLPSLPTDEAASLPSLPTTEPTPLPSLPPADAPSIQTMHPAPVPTATLPLPPQILTDIDLGQIRAVSRQHARLYFDYAMGSWAIEVLGRNGVVVEGKWKAKGEKEGLGSRTKIQIAERIFHFVLPSVEVDDPATMGMKVEEGEEAEGGEEDDSGNSSSSLSDVSEDDIELSPLLQPVQRSRSSEEKEIKEEEEDEEEEDDYGDEDMEMDDEREASEDLTIKLPIPRASGKGGKGRGKGGKGSGSLLRALAPPVRAAARGANYGGQNQVSGKKVEHLQAVRSGGKGKSTLAAIAKNVASTPPVPEESGTSKPSKTGKKRGPYKKKGKMPPQEEDFGPVQVSMPATTMATPAKKAPQKQPKKQHLSTTTSTAASKVPKAQHGIATPPPLPPLPDLPPLPATASSPGQPANAPHLPGAPPVKRGRGRPPKNGVCAQRTNKKKADEAPSATTSGGLAIDPALKSEQSTNPVPTVAAPTVPLVKPAAVVAQPAPTPVPAQALPAPAQAQAQVAAPSTTPALVSSTPVQPIRPVTAPSIPVAPAPTSSLPTPAPAALSQTPLASASTSTQPPAPYPPAPSADSGEPLAAPADDPFAKPPYTYASLIAQAVSSVETKKLTLNGIYDWITARWPYFSDNQNGWQNSIRHNLTLSRGFLKIPRREDEAGKGAFWAIDPAQIRNFDGLHFRKKNIRPNGTAAPGSAPKPSIGGKPSNQPKPKQAPKPNNAGRPGAPGGRPHATPSLSTPLPIIISPIPDSYVRPAPAPSATPPDDLTAALLKDPPIILHEGKLILNPTIFAHLEKEQLDNLQVIPASQALQILQAYVVQHFKEKMRRQAMRPAAPAAAPAAGTSGSTPVQPAAKGAPAPMATTSTAAVPPNTTAAASPAPVNATPAVAASTSAPSTVATPAPPKPEVVQPPAPQQDAGPAKAPAPTAAKRERDEPDSDIEVIEPAAKVAKVET